jgi:hypothetical protein
MDARLPWLMQALGQALGRASLGLRGSYRKSPARIHSLAGDLLPESNNRIYAYGLTCAMNVPQLARAVRGSGGIYSVAIQIEPFSSATAAE